MASLLDNPFAVLRLPAASPAAAVAERARAIGTPAANAAMQALIAPRPRLDAELAFLPGASETEVGKVLDALSAGRTPDVTGLCALARANVLAHLAVFGPCTASMLRRLNGTQALLARPVILVMISGDRSQARMPQPNAALLDSKIEHLRETHASALATGAFALGAKKGSQLLCDLVQSATTRENQLAFLRRAVAAWGRASASRGAELLDEAAQEEKVLADPARPTQSGRLAELIRAWGELTAPQRLVEMHSGLSHAASLDAAQRWRELAGVIEPYTPAAALLLFEALVAWFEALPDLGPQLRADMEACRALADAVAFQEILEREAENKRKEEELEATREREEQERERAAREQEASELEAALRKAIEQAEHGRHVLHRVLAGPQPTAGGPKEVADLRSAFLAAAARLADERAWVLLRGFALRLRDDYAMPVAALSLTAMMLVSARATPEKISPDLLDQLEEDWNDLRHRSLGGQASMSRIVIPFGAVVGLALIGLVAILANHSTPEAVAIPPPANQVSAPLVPEIAPSQPLADNPGPVASRLTDEPPAVDVPATAFDQGRADRREWERWFAGLIGPYRAGAEWWASVRSLKSRPDCISIQRLHGTDFMDGCLEAHRRLTSSDHRRLAEPDYRVGWNSL